MALTLEEIDELKRIASRNSRRQAVTQPAERPMAKTMPGIVINRMYAGEYLSSNLGHEIINLFQADNGQHYLYLNSSGSFARGHENVDVMLMVRYAGRDCFEVVAMAKGLQFAPGTNVSRGRDIMEHNPEICEEQRRYIAQQPSGTVSYGGVSILDIFNDAEQQSVFITYKADKVFLPKGETRIFLKYDTDAENSFLPAQTSIAIKEHNLPKTSLKSYIYPTDGNHRSDYSNLIDNLINNHALWDAGREWKVNLTESHAQKEISLFDICRINDDENRFSNALAFFMTRPEYRGLWREYFKSLGIELEENYNVEREVNSKIEDPEGESTYGVSGGRIDLLVSDPGQFIVIENKIKSDINTNSHDREFATTQLDRYVNYINWRISKENSEHKKTGKFLILCPDYNRPALNESEREYKIITYNDLHSFLQDKKEVDSDPNFRALRNAMWRHTLPTANGYLYNEMQEKFEARIKELKNKIL